MLVLDIVLAEFRRDQLDQGRDFLCKISDYLVYIQDRDVSYRLKDIQYCKDGQHDQDKNKDGMYDSAEAASAFAVIVVHELSRVCFETSLFLTDGSSGFLFLGDIGEYGT